MEDSTIYVQICNETDQDYSVIIDEDNSTVYGYLMRDEEIVSDVWLYNIGKSPDFVEWDDPELMPFPSPTGLSRPDSEIVRIVDSSLIKVEWGRSKLNIVQASIYYANILLAILFEGGFPGTSINAMCDSRLANVFFNDGKQA